MVVMPCGAGKTLLGRWFAEQIQARLTVVVVPKLALIPQTVLAYRSDRSWPHHAMIVCSDDSTGRAVEVDDLNLPRWARESVTASTSTWAVQRFLERTSAAGTAGLIVSTYHSAPQLAAALRRARTAVDLLVCDEAHKLAGRPSKDFRAVLIDAVLPARRRLFLTATPVVIDHDPEWDEAEVDVVAPLSLDDETQFGPTLYRASFADAIAAGRLVDYDVEVIASSTTSSDGAQRVNARAAVLTAAAAGSTRILTFHTRVANARGLAADIDGHTLPDGRMIRAEHLEGSHRASHRKDALDRLANPAYGEVAVLASAQVLTEGVDVPAVDTVLFADPRTSAVDIAQATGRAVRRAAGKSRGHIVLAVALNSRLDEDTLLGSSAWHHVWAVLRALAAMDPRFVATVRAGTGDQDGSVSGGTGPGLHVQLPNGFDRAALQSWILRALDRTGGAWQRNYEALREWARVNGHARPAGRRIIHNGAPITEWLREQQYLHRIGRLSPRRAAALSRLPGFAWTAWEAVWQHAAELWQQAHQNGHLGLDERRWAALAELPAHPQPRSATGAYQSLAEFAVDTDGRYRRGDLPDHLRAAAEQLPQWHWNLLPQDDAAMVDALIEYGAWKRDHNPPHDYLHDGDLALGAWFTAVRRRYTTGRIHPLLRTQLTMFTRVGGHAGRLKWGVRDTTWRLSYLALRQYVAREGHCRIPRGVIEQLPDFELNLGQWCTTQRSLYNQQRMDQKNITALEQIPDWRWEVPSRQAGLPHSVTTEPGYRGYREGCRCDACYADYSRRYNTRWGAYRRVTGPVLVDAATTRGHLRLMMGRGATRDTIARAANLGGMTISKIVNGTTRQIRTHTESAILGLTFDDVKPPPPKQRTVTGHQARPEERPCRFPISPTELCSAPAAGREPGMPGTRPQYCTHPGHNPKAAYDARRTFQRAAAGEPVAMVDAATARGRLRLMMGRGATRDTIARAANLGGATISKIVNGTTRRIRAHTETAILGLTFDDVKPLLTEDRPCQFPISPTESCGTPAAGSAPGRSGPRPRYCTHPDHNSRAAYDARRTFQRGPRSGR